MLDGAKTFAGTVCETKCFDHRALTLIANEYAPVLFITHNSAGFRNRQVLIYDNFSILYTDEVVSSDNNFDRLTNIEVDANKIKQISVPLTININQTFGLSKHVYKLYRFGQELAAAYIKTDIHNGPLY